eukprot:8959206-Pyramimonas_sp.AAC.1
MRRRKSRRRRVRKRRGRKRRRNNTKSTNHNMSKHNSNKKRTGTRRRRRKRGRTDHTPLGFTYTRITNTKHQHVTAPHHLDTSNQPPSANVVPDSTSTHCTT